MPVKGSCIRLGVRQVSAEAYAQDNTSLSTSFSLYFNYLQSQSFIIIRQGSICLSDAINGRKLGQPVELSGLAAPE